MSAVQAEAAELHKAFKAQGAAMQAAKAFINSVDEKLTNEDGILSRQHGAEKLGLSPTLSPLVVASGPSAWRLLRASAR